jgi:hypothetical protein
VKRVTKALREEVWQLKAEMAELRYGKAPIKVAFA